MELFECPDKNIWNKRREWIDNEIEKSITGFSYLVSDHATALFMDIQACYCTGAWLSVIILSISVIDAQLRECEADDDSIGTAQLLNKYYSGTGINWLRKLRNKYVHLNIHKPALDTNTQFATREQLEQDATKAIRMVILALFQSPGT